MLKHSVKKFIRCTCGALGWLVGMQASVLAATPPWSFQQVMQQGLQRYVEARLAQTEVAQAQALLLQARSQLLPLLSLTGSYTHNDKDRISGNIIAMHQNEWAAALQGTLPLLAPQAWGAWSQSADYVGVVEAQRLAVRRQVANLLARGYFAVLTGERLVEVMQTAVETAQAHHAFAQSRYLGGIGNRLDTLRAAAELATSEAQQLASHTAWLRAREALSVLVGESTPFAVESEPQLPELPTTPGWRQGSVAPLPWVQRADLQALQVQWHWSQQAVQLQWLDFMPNLLLQATPFLQDPPLSTVPRRGWQVQLLLSLALYDGGWRYGQHHKQQVNAQQAQLRYDFALSQANSEVRLAQQSYSDASAAQQAAARAAQAAQQALQLAIVAYQAGNSTNLDVVDAQRRSRDANTAAIVASDTWRQAQVDLLLALGSFPS